MPTPAELERAESIFRQAAGTVSTHRQAQATVQFRSASGAPLAGVEVQVEQRSQDFLFGNLVFDLIWRDPPYQPDLFKARFLELFNLAIFPFYWSTYERKPGRPEWQRALPVLEWCRANGVTPKGHPLVWPYSAGVPEWLYDMPEDTVESLIRARVTGLVRGFARDVPIWDVTNEAVNHIAWAEATSRAFRPRYHETTLWRGVPVSAAFKREIPITEAADWVEQALRWAYDANPSAALIVNDYNQEIDPNIRQRFFELICELQDRGAPISGIGLQVHPIDHWIHPAELWDTLEEYARLRLPVHITELHQPGAGSAIEGGWREGVWTPELQAEYVADLYRLCFGHPSVVSINYWGFSERDIWVSGAGLIDEEYKPKPVFHALKRLIKGEWMTLPQTLHAGGDGTIRFNGFYGQHALTVRAPFGRQPEFTIHLAENAGKEWVFTV